jgi:hypothetical protein
VEVRLADGALRYFITWGRIQDTVDPEPLQDLVMRHTTGFALRGDAVSAELCLLREARDAPYFYEALVHFGQQPIPFGRGYQRWRRRIGREMEAGKHLYFLGSP